MSRPVKSLTADCLYCGKPIRRNSVGIWGARKRNDPHPWYCDFSPDQHHAPSPVQEMTEGQRIAEELLLDSSQALTYSREQSTNYEGQAPVNGTETKHGGYTAEQLSTVIVGKRRSTPAVWYVPGSTKFTYAARERRTERCRTWYSPRDGMAYGAECLLCGAWTAGHATRAEAVSWGAEKHPRWCHVINGCHCPEPHITAAMAARIGVKDSYPRSCARELFRMAGGTRRYLPPHVDLNRTPFGPSPEQLGNVRVCLGHGAP